MGRNKKEGGAIIKSFTLTENEVELMEFDKSREGFRSNSEYIGWLIRMKNESTNPAEYFKALDNQEAELAERVSKIKRKRKEAIKNMELTKEIEMAKSKKRPEAIKIIQRKLIEEGIFVAQQVAKNWSMMLNTNASELLAEALINVKKEGSEEKRS